MATAYTLADMVGFYETTAGGVSATLTPAQSLGGFRSPREVRGLEALIDGIMPSAIIENVSGAQGEGTAILSGGDGDSLYFTPSSGTIGSSDDIANGEIKTIFASGNNNFIRVRRDGTAGLGDYLNLDLRKGYNNLLAFDDVSAADSAAGLSQYRAGMFHAHGGGLEDIAVDVYLTALGTQRTTGTAQLGATGAGTITTATANGFADWPLQGWAKISQSGGTLREAVYYTSRTATSLTVPTAGRARLGTTASAGAGTDTIIPIPGIRIAGEAPDSEGKIQTVANTTSAPSGPAFTIPTDATDSITFDLAPGANYGLWINREIPPGATGTYRQETGITVELNDTDYTQKYYGLYRVAQTSLAKYDTYQGVDAFPVFSTPEATSATLPYTLALSAPPSGLRTHRLCTRYTDVYGVQRFNVFPTNIILNSSGVEVGDEVTAPYDVTLENTSSGYARLRAKYATGVDATDADKFRYYVTTNGTNPTTGGTPIDATMAIGQGLSSARILNTLIGPYGYGTDLRVLVTAYRTSDTEQSVNTTPVTVTINTVEPGAPALLSAGYDGAYSGGHGWGIEEKTTYFNSPTNTVFLRASAGMTEFWSGSTLIFRGLYGGDGFFVTYIPNAFTLINDTVSGAGSASAFEVVSANEIYLCVNSTRRVKIDLSAMEITMATLTAAGDAVDNDNPTAATNFVGTGYTTVQIYDPAAGKWGSLLSCDSAGTFNARVIRQIST